MRSACEPVFQVLLPVGRCASSSRYVAALQLTSLGASTPSTASTLGTIALDMCAIVWVRLVLAGRGLGAVRPTRDRWIHVLTRGGARRGLPAIKAPLTRHTQVGFFDAATGCSQPQPTVRARPPGS